MVDCVRLLTSINPNTYILIVQVNNYFQILIGPTHWEHYSKGKEGSTRYRIHNLLGNSGPGVYEFGVAASTSSLLREIYKLATDLRRVVVVYLGKADNVRTRLQCYGRNGAHLGNGCSSFESSRQKGRSLFHEIFFKVFQNCGIKCIAPSTGFSCSCLSLFS